MLKWLSNASKKMPGRRGTDKNAKTRPPHIIPRDQHSISRKNISRAALKVMAQLHAAGYQAFLVGGGVRDLLLGGKPKDFDIATDARPEEIRSLFRGSRIIGRRFKIVHVRFGREIIEVTTFRSGHDAEASDNPRANNGQSAKSEDGMLLRDNVFGTVVDDAWRRDFTINALYYTSADFSLYDYCGGMQDLRDKTLRIIGDAETRYREDPVRMLRAVRFAAKLGFTLEQSTAAPLRDLAESLQSVAAARLFDEMLKLFLTGHAEATFALMHRYGLFTPLFPATGAALNSDDTTGKQLIEQALRNTDLRIRQEKPVTPAFLFAALLWPAVRARITELQADGNPELTAVHLASQEIAGAQQHYIAIPRRFGMPMRDIWDMQWRLPRRSPQNAEKLLEHRMFRAAYDFLLLREQSGETTDELGHWWEQYQLAEENGRRTLCDKVKSSQPARRRKPRNKNKPRP